VKVLNDYQCSDCLKTSEEWLDTEVKSILCTCGGVRHLLVHGGGSYFKIDGSRMDIMSIQWAKRRENNYKKHNNY